MSTEKLLEGANEAFRKGHGSLCSRLARLAPHINNRSLDRTPRRWGASIIEFLIVIAIVGILIGILLPAIQKVRERANEAICMNNLYQVNTAGSNYAETQGHLPGSGSQGFVGGWTIDLLPYIDQKNLYEYVTPGTPISAAPNVLLKQPRIFRCPVRSALNNPGASTMDPSDFVFLPNDKRETFTFSDAPLGLNVPWASGLEMSYNDLIQQIGPHHQGFFYSSGFQQGVQFILGGQNLP